MASNLAYLPDHQTGLRVGLTGGLSSGKSTVGAMLAAHGATVFAADELARSLMQPGQAVFAAIVTQFGLAVVRQDGTLDRTALGRLAFAGGRVEELNAIVHPATIALQATLAAQVFADRPDAIVVVESALIFETKYGGAKYDEGKTSEDKKTYAQPASSARAAAWLHRFDRLILVTAPETLKVARFVARSGESNPAARRELAAEAKRRLAQMISDKRKVPFCDFILHNDGTLSHLQQQVDALWNSLIHLV